MDPNYLSTIAYDMQYQEAFGAEHTANMEWLDMVPNMMKIFEFMRMESVNFMTPWGPTYWADQAYQKARNGLNQDLYDYVMKFPEDRRGTVYTCLFYIGFAQVPYEGGTFWADQAYQLASSNEGR